MNDIKKGDRVRIKDPELQARFPNIIGVVEEVSEFDNESKTEVVELRNADGRTFMFLRSELIKIDK